LKLDWRGTLSTLEARLNALSPIMIWATPVVVDEWNEDVWPLT
jgi:hypothetical protein